MDWPEAMPVADGERYVVGRGGGDGQTLTWHKVDPATADLAAFAQQLADKHCDSQLSTLQANLALAAKAGS